MGKTKYICPCFKVTYDDVRKAVHDGADSFKQVKKATKVSGKCGNCECRVKTFTKEILKDMEKKTCSDKTAADKDKKKASKKIADKSKEVEKTEGKKKQSKKIADKSKEVEKIESRKKQSKKIADKSKEVEKTESRKKQSKKIADRNKKVKNAEGKKKAGKEKNLLVKNQDNLKMRVIRLDDKNYKLKDVT